MLNGLLDTSGSRNLAISFYDFPIDPSVIHTTAHFFFKPYTEQQFKVVLISTAEEKNSPPPPLPTAEVLCFSLSCVLEVCVFFPDSST